jgi:hypothetical protein
VARDQLDGRLAAQLLDNFLYCFDLGPAGELIGHDQHEPLYPIRPLDLPGRTGVRDVDQIG